MIFYLFWTLLFAGATLCAWHVSTADFRRRIIPDVYLVPLFLMGLVTLVFFPHWFTSIPDGTIGAVMGYLLGAITGFVFDYVIRKKNPKSDAPIGMGDIKLLATGGLWLGTFGLSVALIFACIFGGIWGRYKKQRFIPFAPFFVTGAILALIIMAFLV